MRDKSFPTSTTFVFVAILVYACLGCSDALPSSSQYAENVQLNATREEGNLIVEINRPPRLDGFSETCMVKVSMQGAGYGRILLAETDRQMETSSTRLISTELTDQERSAALEVQVDFAVWKSRGYHNSSELLRGTKVVRLPLSHHLP